MKTERTRLRRAHHKGRYDSQTLYALLDAVPLCHIAYVHDGQPYATPTFQWREGDYVYWHGSSASRALLQSDGAPVCMTVTQIDGLVLARSGFEHSANFQSAMILGKAERVQDQDEKARQLEYFMEALFPGRWDELRPMTQQELKATTVMRLALQEASVKLRTGPPDEKQADQQWPVWGGVVPIEARTGKPEPDAHNRKALPDYLQAFQFKYKNPSIR